jgi:hypothetical protein
MPRWSQAPNTEDKIQLATKTWNLGYYKSKEACAVIYNINLNTFRCRLNGKQMSYKVAYTN